MTDGVEVVCHPANIILSPESGVVQVRILLTPCQPGQLSISGENSFMYLILLSLVQLWCYLQLTAFIVISI